MWQRVQKSNSALRCVLQQMVAEFLPQANRWSTWPIGRRVRPIDKLHIRKSWQHVGERSGDFVCAWRLMKQQMVAGLLDFSPERPRSTSVWLVSSSKGLICTDLKEEAQIACLVDLRYECEQQWLHDYVESRSERQQGKSPGWKVNLCVHGKFLCCVEMFV